MFAYLKKYNRSRLVFDKTEPTFADSSACIQADQVELYPDDQEAIPLNVPKARGNSVSSSVFANTDHTGCQVTHRSTTGILIFVNRAPIFWSYRRQNTVESSTFGLEHIAMRQVFDYIVALRYKLRMIIFPFEGQQMPFLITMILSSTLLGQSLFLKSNIVVQLIIE